jgi:hypothetical protein
VPVVLRLKGYKFWFYQADLDEPPHVHVGKDGNEAKYWLNPVCVANTGRFSQHELNQIEKILIKQREHVLAIWWRENAKRENC